MDFEIWWLLAYTFWMTVVFGIYKLTIAYLTRNAPRALSQELENRLSRIEHAVDSTALEVERIGESQRFLTRQLAERLETGHRPSAPQPERVITPH